MSAKIVTFAMSKRVFFALKKRMRFQGRGLAVAQNRTLWGQKEAIKNQKQMLKIKKLKFLRLRQLSQSVRIKYNHVT